MLKTRSGISSLRLFILLLYLIFSGVIFCVNCINLNEIFFYTDQKSREPCVLQNSEMCNEDKVSYDNKTVSSGYDENDPPKFSEISNNEKMVNQFNSKKNRDNLVFTEVATTSENEVNEMDNYAVSNSLENNDVFRLIPDFQFDNENIDSSLLNPLYKNHSSFLLSNSSYNDVKFSSNVSVMDFSVENEFKYYNETKFKVNSSSKMRVYIVSDTHYFPSDSVERSRSKKTESRTEDLTKFMNSRSSSQSVNENITITEQNILIESFKRKYPVDSWLSAGYFTEEYLHKINTLWLGFDPPLHSSHYILAVLYCIVMTIGVSGNCLVIFMFLRCRSLRVPANTLVINLAVSDFLMLIKMPIFIFNSLYFGPILGEPGCQIYGFLGGLTGTVSIMTLAAIALDRYYAIVHPLDPLRKTTTLRARLSVLFVWCYGCLFASLPLTGLGLNRYVPEGYLTSCSFDYLTSDLKSRIFIFVFFVAAWVIPFSVITICYFNILLEVIKTGSASSRHGQEVEKRRTEIRLAGMVIGVIGLWFLAWTPYAIVALLGIFGFHHLISPLGSMIPALFCKSASCIDPYIYALTHPRFRREITKLFLSRKSRMSQRYQSRKYHMETTRVSSIYMRRQDSCNEVELQELKIVPIQHIQQPRRKTWLLSKVPLPSMTNNKSNSRCKSLQDSKKSLSTSYSNANSSPF